MDEPITLGTRPTFDDVLTVPFHDGNHEAIEVTGRVVSLAFNGDDATIHLRLIDPPSITAPSGRQYDQVYVKAIINGESPCHIGVAHRPHNYRHPQGAFWCPGVELKGNSDV
jgi:hypothetical protein